MAKIDRKKESLKKVMRKELETIVIVDYENALLVEKKEGYNWIDKKLQRELKSEDIIFNGDCHAVKIVEKKEDGAIFALGMKQIIGRDKDGTLCFEKTRNKFQYMFNSRKSGDLVFSLNSALDLVKYGY